MSTSDKPWRSKTFLHDRYVKQKKTIDQIAAECEKMGFKVTPMTIYNNLKSFDLIRNSRNLGQRSFKSTKGNPRIR